MVSGGPYDIEDIIGYGGYGRALLLIFILPFFWSFPTALMLGELASAVPAEGGFYAWVHRALGPFWGFQEAWLSLTASVFDMAIYPILFVTYLGFVGRHLEGFLGGHDHWQALARASTGERGAEAALLGVGMIACCALLNLR